jgi:hypothetical protein
MPVHFYAHAVGNLSLGEDNEGRQAADLVVNSFKSLALHLHNASLRKVGVAGIDEGSIGNDLSNSAFHQCPRGYFVSHPRGCGGRFEGSAPDGPHK